MQDKIRKTADARINELEAKVKEIEEQYEALKERSVRLLDTERRRCLEYVPSKGTYDKTFLLVLIKQDFL